jgi:hypothetical protein
LAVAATDDSGELRDVASSMSGEGASYEPDEGRAAFYDRIYKDIYREIYPRLSTLFPAFAEIIETEPPS